MSAITIYHNPRCSKSRQTLQLLQDNNITPTVVEYLKQPLSVVEIEALITKLGVNCPREMMRVKEADYKEQALGNTDVTAQQLIEAMAQTPKLIERPIVVNGDKAAIGRPPEQVLDII
ncbi:arsenate reductase (glutaredoxin) [Psychrobium sp. 1_MG-2023]|uniref:arsenate reductase (glutaredoxin) n=1 Tax=Psychrobium sp. 1_MG-2023 TaxID=3062624 RepID=UPI000C340F2C|nr:arsenate reductase (glutaredoxin) [Psychrobium sp. 1_MG-2023]MDP2560294.1 arsenate reductase (glutaredoxin) [Psychrobium sp. 1_MG-2023]PKF55411.1 arsenate reductase (glutaredoxin) [Alteromonadales bacterium alter-6D02]